jgi:hypothetical protein
MGRISEILIANFGKRSEIVLKLSFSDFDGLTDTLTCDPNLTFNILKRIKVILITLTFNNLRVN